MLNHVSTEKKLGFVNKESIKIIVDTREQLPYTFGVESERRKLDTGDYSIDGMEDKVCVERKSLDDFVNTIIHGKERFEREIERMKLIEHRMIIIEADLSTISQAMYTSRTHPSCVIGKILSLIIRDGIHIFLAGSRQQAQVIVERYLCKIFSVLNEKKDGVE